MFRSGFLTIIFIGILLVFATTGCSSGLVDQVSPGVNEDSFSATNGIPVPMEDMYPHRALWAMWNIYFNVVELTAEIEPVRYTQAHYNITEMLLPPNCDDCLKIKVNSFDPDTHILDTDVTLKNPSQLQAFDVRGILYTNDFGHKLLNFDNWTKLFDIPGGELLNPFRAFAKSEDFRSFAPSAEHMEKYLVYIPIPPEFEAITFAVEASWPSNCKEPYEITNFWQEIIYDEIGSKGNIHVDVRDWQGDVNKVTLVAPEITGEQFAQFSKLSDDTWRYEVTNNTGIGPGSYEVRIIAASENSGDISLYQFTRMTITEAPPIPDPDDITPPWLNLTPWDVFIFSDYAYVASGNFGLNIFDITDPLEPLWVSWVDTPGEAFEVMVSNGYAYLEDNGIGLQIIDIDPPESAYLVTTVPNPDISGLFVRDGLAYVTRTGSALDIIDIDPPETANVVNSLSLEGDARSVSVQGEYAYVVNSPEDKISVVDVVPPVDAEVIWEVDLGSSGYRIAIDSNLAYITTFQGFVVIDISGPPFPVVLDGVEGVHSGRDIAVAGGYAFITDFVLGVYIVDIDPLESAILVDEIDDTPYLPRGVDVIGDYLYVTGWKDGMLIVDVSSPGAVEVVHTVPTIALIHDVAVDGDSIYILDNSPALKIIKADPVESAYIVNTVEISGNVQNMTVSDGYAYVTHNLYDLHIIDIDPAGMAGIVKTVNTPGVAPTQIVVVGDYAYILEAVDYWYDPFNFYLSVVDIEFPESAYFAGSFYIAESANGLAVSGGYAFIESTDLLIYDVDPLESAYQINSIGLAGELKGIGVSGSYAYVSCGESIFQIVDIDLPESAFSVSTTDIGYSGDVTVQGGYAYVASSEGRFLIVDIDPVDTAYVILSFEVEGELNDVEVNGNYAYLGAWHGGLRILKLW